MKARSLFFVLILLISSFAMSAATNHRVRETIAAVYSKVETEEELTLETWMVSECYWKCQEINCMRRDYDHALELESWMTDQKTWDWTVLMAVEKEDTLKLEGWMTESNKWVNGGLEGQSAEKTSYVQND